MSAVHGALCYNAFMTMGEAGNDGRKGRTCGNAFLYI